jgi:hypothetical protein
LLAVAIAMATSIAAHAETARNPVLGDPALEIEVPGGWKASVGQDGVMLVESASGRSKIWLRMYNDPNVAKIEPEKIAAFFFKNMGAAEGKYARTDPEKIGGRRGETFASAVVDSGGFQVPMVVTLLKLNDRSLAFVAYGSTQSSRGVQHTRSASSSSMSNVGARPVQTLHSGEARVMDIILDEIKIVGLK